MTEPPLPPSPPKLAVLSWLGACAFGMWLLATHASQPGAAGQVAKQLPPALAARIAAEYRSDQVERYAATETAILLVAAHPQCPCLATTLDELERLLDRVRADARCPTPLICMLAYLPTVRPKAWRNRGEAERARFAERSQTLWLEDRDGELSALLGMKTSGHVALYGTAEAATDGLRPLRFEGGITAARGHTGDSPGANRLLAILTAADDSLLAESPGSASPHPKSPPSAHHPTRHYPVFGCSLQSPQVNCHRCPKHTPSKLNQGKIE